MKPTRAWGAISEGRCAQKRRQHQHLHLLLAAWLGSLQSFAGGTAGVGAPPPPQQAPAVPTAPGKGVTGGGGDPGTTPRQQEEGPAGTPAPRLTEVSKSGEGRFISRLHGGLRLQSESREVALQAARRRAGRTQPPPPLLSPPSRRVAGLCFSPLLAGGNAQKFGALGK